MDNKKRITFGLEAEFVSLTDAAGRAIANYGFGMREDASICDNAGNRLPRYNMGQELVTPIYVADVEQVNGTIKTSLPDDSLEAIKMLVASGTVNSTCGIHVHLGKPDGGETTWNPKRQRGVSGGPSSEWKPSHVRAWLAIGLALEESLYSVVPTIRRHLKHCASLRTVYSCEDLMAYKPVGSLVARKYENSKRYTWLNAIETSRPKDPRETRIGYAASEALGTMETRMLGEVGPDEAEYVVDWVKLFVKISAAIAYMPSEQAILWCVHSDWLKDDLARLKEHQRRHELVYAPRVRSTLPIVNANHAHTEGE